MSDDLTATCDHGRTSVDCPVCLSDAVDEWATLAEIEEAMEASDPSEAASKPVCGDWGRQVDPELHSGRLGRQTGGNT